jgi:hypothetical protein
MKINDRRKTKKAKVLENMNVLNPAKAAKRGSNIQISIFKNVLFFSKSFFMVKVPLFLNYSNIYNFDKLLQQADNFRQSLN